MAVGGRAKKVGHDFLYRMRRDERARGLAQIDYIGDWHAAEKAVTGVEVRDPTADMDVVSYCFGVPPEQYLAEGIDRSLIRRAMWGLLPEIVLTNRLSGLQGADWHEKLESQRRELACPDRGARKISAGTEDHRPGAPRECNQRIGRPAAGTRLKSFGNITLH